MKKEEEEDCNSKWVAEGPYSSLDCPEFDQYECDNLDLMTKETLFAKKLTRVKSDKGCEITLRKHLKTWNKKKDDPKPVVDQKGDQKTTDQPGTTKKTKDKNDKPQIPANQDKMDPTRLVQKPTISRKSYKKPPQKGPYVKLEEVFPPPQFKMQEKPIKPTESDPKPQIPADQVKKYPTRPVKGPKISRKIYKKPPQKDPYVKSEEVFPPPQFEIREKPKRPTKSVPKPRSYGVRAPKKTKADFGQKRPPDDDTLHHISPDENHQPKESNKQHDVKPTRKTNGRSKFDREKKPVTRPTKPAIKPFKNGQQYAGKLKNGTKNKFAPTAKQVASENGDTDTEESSDEVSPPRNVEKKAKNNSADAPSLKAVQVHRRPILSIVDPESSRPLQMPKPKERPMVNDQHKSKLPSLKNDWKTNSQQPKSTYNEHVKNGQRTNNVIAPFLSPEEMKYYQQSVPADETSVKEPENQPNEVKIVVKAPVESGKSAPQYYPVPVPQANRELLVPVYGTKKTSGNGQSTDDSSSSSSNAEQPVPGVKRSLVKALAKEVVGTSDATHPGVKRALGKALVKEITNGTKRSIKNGAQHAVQLQPWCKTGQTVKLHDASPEFPVEVTDKYLASASLRPIDIVSLDEEPNGNVIRENDGYPRKELRCQLENLPSSKNEKPEQSPYRSITGKKEPEIHRVNIGTILQPVKVESKTELSVFPQQGFAMNLQPPKPPVTTVTPVYLVEDENGSRVYEIPESKPTDVRSRFRRAGNRLRNAFRALGRDETDDVSAHPPGWKDNKVFVPTHIAQPGKQPAWRNVKPASHFGPEVKIKWVQKN